jgi:putative ABC transport system permease protein
MHPFETLALALAALKSNKLRSALTMLGIGVGVFSLIGVMTIITGLRTSIESGLNVLGANSFLFTKNPGLSFTGPRIRLANRHDITYAEAARFKALLGDEADTGLVVRRNGRRASYLDRRTNPNVGLYGCDENYVTGRDYDVASGRNLGESDIELGRAVCIIGDDLAKRLFPNEEPLGHALRIDGQSFTIVGALTPKGSSFGQSQDNFVLIPITRWLQIYGGYGRSVSINVQARSQAELAATQDRAIGLMRLVRGLEPEDENDFEMISNDSLIEAFNQIAGVVAVGAFVISAIALLASGVGVMNIMLVSVTERTKEIGIRKSIGAKKRHILTQFLIEAVALSLLGGITGVLVGIVGGNLVAHLLNAAMVFPWVWAMIGLAVCSAIGVGFGLYPAWKAASLDPIEALRHE